MRPRRISALHTHRCTAPATSRRECCGRRLSTCTCAGAELPDGEFPTVSYPNPGGRRGVTLGLKLAKEVDADLVLATDPDVTGWVST